jgi:hypothetical protein
MRHEAARRLRAGRRDVLMEAVSIAVRDGHARALIAHPAALDVIGYMRTQAVGITTGRHDWSLLNVLQQRMATSEAIAQSTAGDAMRRHGHARQPAAEAALDRLGRWRTATVCYHCSVSALSSEWASGV